MPGVRRRYGVRPVRRRAAVRRRSRTGAGVRVRRVRRRAPRVGVVRRSAPLTRLVAGRTAFATLHWDQITYSNTVNTELSAGAGYSTQWWPMNTSPTVDPTSGLPTPVSGQVVWAGMTQFGQYYSSARLHRASIRVRATYENASVTDPYSLRLALVSLPYRVDGTISKATTPGVLASLPFDTLRSASGVKTAVLTYPTGGRSTRTLFHSGRTAVMMGKRFIQDAGGVPGAGSAITGSSYACGIDSNLSVTATNWANPLDQWYFGLFAWYDSDEADSTAQLTLDVRITGVWEFYNRVFITDATLTS